MQKNKAGKGLMQKNEGRKMDAEEMEPGKELKV
jgi:hypothetical protein